ncbi:MAG: hypothetical protein MAG431_00837 [Chloroflexi bacterium]|nr:hypothetical protein [Chloroflexota bacterium]
MRNLLVLVSKTIAQTKVRRSAGIGGGVVPKRGAPID